MCISLQLPVDAHLFSLDTFAPPVYRNIQPGYSFGSMYSFFLASSLGLAVGAVATLYDGSLNIPPQAQVVDQRSFNALNGVPPPSQVDGFSVCKP